MKERGSSGLGKIHESNMRSMLRGPLGLGRFNLTAVLFEENEDGA